MAAPEGYSALAKIGFVDRGTYAAATTYNRCDVVYYGGSTYVALKDNLKGVTPANGANWKYMARGFAAEVLAAITAVDASGVIGTPGASVSGQALIDGIADKVMTKLILRSKIVNNLLATDTTTVLSGPMGKQLDEKIDSVISDLAVKYGPMNFKNGWSHPGERLPYIARTGNIITIRFPFCTGTAGAIVCTIPENYKLSRSSWIMFQYAGIEIHGMDIIASNSRIEEINVTFIDF